MGRRKKAIVLLSGGLDSAVALAWAKKKKFQCYALTFDYGQRHKREMRSAKRLAVLSGVPLRRVQFRLPWGGSVLTNKKSKLPHRPVQQMSAVIPPTYVPGRN